MNANTASTTAPRTATGAKPTHRIYRVSGEGQSANWTPIGAAWPNRDGEGFSITCDAMPLTGRIVMRRITERPAQDAAQAGGQK